MEILELRQKGGTEGKDEWEREEGMGGRRERIKDVRKARRKERKAWREGEREEEEGRGQNQPGKLALEEGTGFSGQEESR